MLKEGLCFSDYMHMLRPEVKVLLPSKMRKPLLSHNSGLFWSLLFQKTFKYINTFKQGSRPGGVSVNFYNDWLIFFLQKANLSKLETFSNFMCLASNKQVWHRMLSWGFYLFISFLSFFPDSSPAFLSGKCFIRIFFHHHQHTHPPTRPPSQPASHPPPPPTTEL